MNHSHDITTYGKRLLPHIVDQRANSGYERPYAMYPVSQDLSEGFQSISYARLSNAVNRACWWLESELSGEEKETPFAYLGPNDLRYAIFVLATIKTGRKILISSLRNTVGAELSLFEKASCKVLVSCSSLNQSLQPLFVASEGVRRFKLLSLTSSWTKYQLLITSIMRLMRLQVMTQSFTFILPGHQIQGNPKPISWNKSFLCALDTEHILPTGQGASLSKTFMEDQNLLTLLPCFHAGGLCFNLFPAFYDMTLVLGHPDVPMSAHYVSQLLEHGSITALLTPPSILEDLSNDPQSLNNLAKLSQIGYGGGPLQPDVGNLLASRVPHLFSYIGATEYGWFHNICGDNSTWDSLRYSAGIGYRFDEVSEGIFEFVIDNDPRTNKYHGIFEVFPELKEYRMRDLYTANPSAPGWMRYRGRSDDLIVLSNGEKINPIPMENIIRSHPGVKAALVVGEYRFNPSLLIEMDAGKIPQTEAERCEALDQLWPSVQEANKIAAGFAKVPKSLILFASAQKPFQRAGKGTVQRQLTVKAYAEELEYLYSSQESDLLIEGLTLRKAATPDDIRVFVKEIYTQALEKNGLEDSDDVFQQGMDSLGVAVIVARLKAALRYCEVSLDIAGINQRLIYSAPFIEKITRSILNLIKGTHETPDANEVASTIRRAKLETLLEKYTAGINIDTARTNGSEIERRTPEFWNVILTGTTGSLGSHLLATLDAMPDSKIRRIFCLNRSADGKARQEKSNTARGLRFTWNERRVQFVQADLTRADLGLGPEKYTELLRDATVIIHSAWKVDFNLSVDSFEPQIKGVRKLLDFSANSANKAPLIFISSISTAFGWREKHPNTMVPDAVIDDFDAPEQMGYGESKFISEHLIKKYAAASGVNAAIFRTGQIAGSLSGKGIWNKQEWFPSLMTSSKHLGAVPENLGSMEVVDWIPADLLASIMIELTAEVIHQSSQEGGKTSVYNLVNPKSTTWSSLCSPVRQLASIPRAVPLKEWVQLLEESSKEKNGAIVDTNPAVKLLNFFSTLGQREIPSFSSYDVTSLVGDSQTAANLEAVKPKWIQLWLSRWT